MEGAFPQSPGRTHRRLLLLQDEGADEIDGSGRPEKLRHKEYFPPEQEPFENERNAFAPLVWQLRYSGIEVPDELWSYCTTGKGVPYSEDQAEDMVRDGEFMRAFDEWADRFAGFVARKGKLEPGEHRAYGFTAPAHRWSDAKLRWRELRMGIAFPPLGSSPAEQQQMDLNRDATLRPKQSEVERQYD